MPVGVQRFRRTKMVLPVRLCPSPGAKLGPAALAHTVDISSVGAQLGRVPLMLTPGQKITLQRHHNHADFRVVWIQQLGPSEIRAGIESCVGLEKTFWCVDLPPDSYPEIHGVAALRAISVCPEPTFAMYLFSRFQRQTRNAAIVAILIIALTGLSSKLRVSPRSERAIAMMSTAPSVPWALVGAVPVASAATAPSKTDAVQVISSTNHTARPVLRVVAAPQGFLDYPEAPQPDLMGKVRLNLVISKTGRVKIIQVLSGNPLLTTAAIDAIRHWHYSPFELNGQAVDAETSVSITFLGQDAVTMNFPSEQL